MTSVTNLCMGCTLADRCLRPDNCAHYEPAVARSGRKDDDGKPRLDLLPGDAMLVVGRVLTLGAAIYGARNWELGMSWGRLSGAALRHIFAWMRGEDADPTSGEPHLAHAAASILMLLALTLRAHGRDDRKLPGA